MTTTADLLAYDRASVRRYDHDGRLHVEMAHISKANICPYYGREIPNGEALGLRPDTVYQLFRDPAELKKGAATSNNIQLMQVHDPVTTDQPKQMEVVGSTGTDATFETPYLDNSLAVWVQSAIDLIESDRKKQLSCAYHYRADMTPGTYEGTPYDGVMRDIRFNHVALVEEGRVGDDVVIGDSMPPGIKGTQHMKTSRKAAIARGALAIYLRPKLAQDAKIDLKAALLGTTAINWPTAKPTIVARVKAMTAGKLAQDASLEDLTGLLDSLDREGEDEMEDIEGMDEESEEDKAKREAKENADKAAADEEAETPEEKAARMKKRADDKAAKDAEMPEALKAAAKKEAEAARDSEPKPITKAAMDAAIAAAVTATQVTQQQIRKAERDVFPWVGTVLAQNAPEDVYRLALDSLPNKPNLTGVHPSAYKAILAAYPKPGSRGAQPPIAMDAAGASDFDKRFPNVARIRTA